MEEEKIRNYCIFDVTDKRVIKLKHPDNLLLTLELLRDHQLALYTGRKEDTSNVDLRANVVAEELKFKEITEDDIISNVDMDKFLKRFPAKTKQNLTEITDIIIEQYRHMVYDTFSNIHRCSKLQYCMDDLNCLGSTEKTNMTFKHLWDDEWYEHDMIVMKMEDIRALAATIRKYLSQWPNLEDIQKSRELLELVTKYKSLKDNSKLFNQELVKTEKNVVKQMQAF